MKLNCIYNSVFEEDPRFVMQNAPKKRATCEVDIEEVTDDKIRLTQAQLRKLREECTEDYPDKLDDMDEALAEREGNPTIPYKAPPEKHRTDIDINPNGKVELQALKGRLDVICNKIWSELPDPLSIESEEARELYIETFARYTNIRDHFSSIAINKAIVENYTEDQLVSMVEDEGEKLADAIKDGDMEYIPFKVSKGWLPGSAGKRGEHPALKDRLIKPLDRIALISKMRKQTIARLKQFNDEQSGIVGDELEADYVDLKGYKFLIDVVFEFIPIEYANAAIVNSPDMPNPTPKNIENEIGVTLRLHDLHVRKELEALLFNGRKMNWIKY